LIIKEVAMYPRQVEVRNAAEAAAVEQALAMVRELDRLADEAEDGHVIAQVEQVALDQGRRFTRERLQDVLNRQAQALEKKGGADGTVPAAGLDAIRGGPNAGS
jgi:hypothetical protein